MSRLQANSQVPLPSTIHSLFDLEPLKLTDCIGASKLTGRMDTSKNYNLMIPL